LRFHRYRDSFHFQWSSAPRDLHSFPTRRSSDLQHHRDDPAGGVAHHLLALLDHDGGELLPPQAQPGERVAHAASPWMSAMNASSSVGSASAGLRTLSLSSSGVPSAIFLPRQMRPMRSQYSASSMKCVVTTTATPRVVSALMWCQNSRRMSGSTPLVGSSRNSTAGACSVEQASARRCLKS